VEPVSELDGQRLLELLLNVGVVDFGRLSEDCCAGVVVPPRELQWLYRQGTFMVHRRKSLLGGADCVRVPIPCIDPLIP
jgi:hypothetical protein